MKRAALVLAACCLAMAGCDDDDDDNRRITTPAVAPPVIEGPANPQPPPGAPADNSAPSLSLRFTDRTGPAPLTLTVRMCESSDPDRDHLNYLYKWGDGSGPEYHEHAGFCSLSHTYRRVGRHRAIFCVDDGWSDHRVCDDFFVTVQ
jgi:hypothetical protein